jgi:RNA polymerase sigma-70 factor (ECF subfamily)
MSSFFPAARFPALPLSEEKGARAVDKAPNSTASSDEALIARVRENDNDALGMLFQRYARLVWTVAERIVRNKAEADDLLQDVFLLIRKKASAFNSLSGSVRSLIVHMTYQQALSRRRYLNLRNGQAHEQPEGRSAAIGAPNTQLYDQSIEAHFGQEQLREALKELSNDQRRTLELFFQEGYTTAEIAQRLEQSVGQVKHHYYRGLEKLRKRLLNR